jgi:hypothetical protein
VTDGRVQPELALDAPPAAGPSMALLVRLPGGPTALVPAQPKPGSRSSVIPVEGAGPILAEEDAAPGGALWRALRDGGWRWVQDGGAFGPKLWRRD